MAGKSTKKKPRGKKILIRTATLDQYRRIRLVFKGEPKAMQSFRVAVRGKFVQKYQPSGNVEWKNYIRLQAMQQLPEDFEMFRADTPLCVESNFYFAIPSSFPKALKAGIENGTAVAFHIKKPDLSDNLKKGLNDALNGIIWEDDRHIAVESGSKEYSNNPRIELTVTPMIYIDQYEEKEEE